ncbi:hypothetical protein BDZ89DRAFT_1061544 [Hymenopellis radicata]|nr:hypothetical protein BDZ89DRAFT_1061544 [Hymenopellis radicata]
MVAYEAPTTASQNVRAFNAFNIDGMLATFDDESFEFILLPTAMKVPKMNKKHTLGPSFDGMSVSNTDHIKDEAQSDSISKQGTEWHNEYIFIFKSYTEYVNRAVHGAGLAQEGEEEKGKGGALRY